MSFKGGYDISHRGRPSPIVKRLPEPNELYLPLVSKRFSFDAICVEDGQQVNAGDAIAMDSSNFGLPLLAPRGGTVGLGKVAGHIVLTNLSPSDKKANVPEKLLPHIIKEAGTADIKRHKLVSLGAWQFFHDAYTNELPDPLGTPQAVIISTMSLEPFLARGDVQLQNRLLQFTRGLEHLQSLLEYQAIYLVIPAIKTEFSALVKEHIRGYAWAKLVEVPLKYPYDNFNVLARHLGLKRSAGPIWAIRTEGVLAIDRALTVDKPCLVRIIAVGGSGSKTPVHLKAMPGYPVKGIIERYATSAVSRTINGGMLTGKAITEESLGLDTECRGLTIIPEPNEREFLGFVRPGADRQSYSNCFLSSLRADFLERLTTAVRGEDRPCVSCNYCEEVCPAGIMPHLIHKHLYADDIEEADAARVDLCVECGLCSYVCPSKIDLMDQFIKAKKEIAIEQEEIRKEQQRQEELRQKEAEQESAEEKNL